MQVANTTGHNKQTDTCDTLDWKIYITPTLANYTESFNRV